MKYLVWMQAGLGLKLVKLRVKRVRAVDEERLQNSGETLEG